MTMHDARALAGLRVKPLEWKSSSNGGYVARPQSGLTFSIDVFHDGWDLLIDGQYTKPYRGGVRETYTLDAAKAAAQADYESRILSAIDRLAAPEGVGLTRYDTVASMLNDDGEFDHILGPSPEGEWVRYEDLPPPSPSETNGSRLRSNRTRTRTRRSSR